MEDSRIIELYFKRDPDAVKETEKKYGAFLQRLAEKILENRESAEECVNDTYLNTWNAIPPERPAVFSAFLGKITRNLAFNRCKKDRAEKRGGGKTALILDELSEIVSGKDSVERETDGRELSRAINLFLTELSRGKRDIFVARYWHADSVDTIAKRFGMSQNAVYTTLSRTRGKLRKFLSERGFDL